jgi:2-polyprenyl-3-methyl-5-hydroxy-6-metoxy-1,4-benzoquinol methylase
MFFAYQASFALKTAVELNLFSALSDGPLTSAQLAERVSASEKGTRVLADFLTIAGLLQKHDATYTLTPDSAVFLDQKSPAYIGSVSLFLLHPFQVKHFADLTDAVKRGGADPQQSSVSPDNPIWVDFARYMAPFSRFGASIVANAVATPGTAQKVLDIAAGPGLFGIEVARVNPQAQVYGLDWPNVLAVSAGNAAKFGVADRYHKIEGSAFEAHFGTGYDVVLLPNFLHHFNHAENVELLKRVRAALKPGGKVATVEMVPNPDRITPAPAAAFSITMLSNTASGDAYTFAELDEMFREAGFGKTAVQPLEIEMSTLLVTEY